MSEQTKKGLPRLSKKYLYYKLLGVLYPEGDPDFHKRCADHFERLMLYSKEINEELGENESVDKDPDFHKRYE